MGKQSIQQQLTMISFLLCLSLFLHPQIVNAATTNQPYTPTDHILLNCGSPSKLSATDGQSWDGDVGTKFSPDINKPNISFPATAGEQDPSISSEVPYITARIFNSQFSYSFPVSPGQKILRLYFYPATYSGSNFLKNQSFFSVSANQYSLLSNFSAYLSAQKSASLVKEFIINVGQIQLLNVTFVPAANSYAFVNGIEVVSIPDNFYMGSHDINNNPLKLVIAQTTLYDFDQNRTAFETVYRLNIGGQAISAVDDTGMFRQWFQDGDFIFGGNTGNPLSNAAISLQYTSQTPNYTAPSLVYTTARAMGSMSTRYDLTWIFPVDSGFYYLLRLHFCEFMPYLFNATGQRVFTIVINNRTAEQSADVIWWAGGTGIPVFREYAVFVPNASNSQSKQDLFLALHPDFEANPRYLDAILNGLEIFKLNSTAGNLAGPNPEPSGTLKPNTKPPEEKKRKGNNGIILGVFGGVVGAGMVGAGVIVFFLALFVTTNSRSTKTTASGGSSSLQSHLCRRFLLEEIKSATSNFDDAYVIGTGGFGNVYKGYIDNDLTAVAIKRLNPSSRQGAREFRAEIEMLSNLRHYHLVSLIGYCDEKGEMILVYDYMSNGTLRDHLYETENQPLPWKQRLQICIGAAKGLHYLHSGAKHNIIHRDVKSTNILLDEKWVAKVSDFGLSKLGPPAGGPKNHVSTQVKGSFGYVDPEYYRRQQLTDRSDVYSFGVVLFEVLCGRPAVALYLPTEQHCLAEWARRCYTKGIVHQIVDPNLKVQIAPECLWSYSELAFNCLKDQGVDRPAMSDVVGSLEFALQLQEAADKDGQHCRPILIPLNLDGREGNITTSDDDTEAALTSGELYLAAAWNKLNNQSSTPTESFSTTSSSDNLKPGSVFSLSS